MSYFDDFKSFLLRKPVSDPHVDTDAEYTRHRAQAEFDNSPTGRELRKVQSAPDVTKPIEKISKEQAKQKPAEVHGPVDEREIDIHSGKPVGEMPTVTPEMIQREKVQASATHGQMLKQNLQDTSASMKGVQSAQPPTMLDSVINVLDYPAYRVREAIAKKISEQTGANVTADNLGEYVGQKTAPGDPIGQAVNSLLTGLLTDPANYVPVIGLPMSAYKTAGKAAVKGLEKVGEVSKALGVDLAEERGTMYGKELTTPLSELPKPVVEGEAPKQEQAVALPTEVFSTTPDGVFVSDLAVRQRLIDSGWAFREDGVAPSSDPQSLLDSFTAEIEEANANAPQTLARPEAPEVPVFYSPTERVIEQKMPNAASPEQILGIIQSSGIPTDEAKWMDLDSFVKGKKSVTKEELLGFIRSHRIQLEEVRLGQVDPQYQQKLTQWESEVARLEAAHNAAEDQRIQEAVARGESPLPEGSTVFDDEDEFTIDKLEELDQNKWSEIRDAAYNDAYERAHESYYENLSDRWREEALDDDYNHEYSYTFDDYTAYGNDEQEYWHVNAPGETKEFTRLEDVKRWIAEQVAEARRSDDGVDEEVRQLTIDGEEEGARTPVDQNNPRYDVESILEHEMDDDADDMGIPEDRQSYEYSHQDMDGTISGNEYIGYHATVGRRSRDFNNLDEAKQWIAENHEPEIEPDPDDLDEAVEDHFRDYLRDVRAGLEDLPEGVFIRGINLPDDGTVRMPFQRPPMPPELRSMRNGGKLPTQYESYTLPGGSNKREFLLKIPKLDYTAPHFGRDNHASDLLMHFRVSDRYVEDPNTLNLPTEKVSENVVRLGKQKRVLMVEEIQSDLNQAGRESGFRDNAKAAELQPLAEAAQKEYDDLSNKYYDTPSDSPEYETLRVAKQEAYKKWQDLEREWDAAKAGPPDNPFKKEWRDLAVKRILRLAAEEGYDYVAWTTGEQQGKRYRGMLAEHIDMISWTRLPDGKYNLALFKNGREVTPQREELKGLSPERLRNVIGTEMAQKIEADPGTKIVYEDEGADEAFKQSGPIIGELTGTDITVGASGMKGFYDDILPKSVGKYVKKWDGKVGELDFRGAWDTNEYGGTKVHAVEITPKMADAVLNNPQSLLGGAFQTVEDHLKTLPKMIQQQLRDKLPAPKAWKKLEEEGGYFSLGPSLFITRAVLGGLAGAVVGDEEDSIRNALLGAGLGAIASPALIGKLVQFAKAKGAAKLPERVFKPVTDYQAFLDARGKVERQAYFTPMTVKDLEKIVADGGMVMMDQDASTGYILTKDGDLQGVFNGGPAGMGKYAVRDAVARGAKTLDAFDGFLPDYYRQFGFLETGRAKFDPNLAAPGVEQALGGRPDVVFMEKAKPLSEYQKLYKQLVDNARDGVRHDVDVKEEGDLLANYGVISEESIKSLYPGSTMNDAQIYALHKVLTDSGRHLLTLVGEVKDDATLQEFLKAFYVHSMLLDPKRLGVEADTGRALRMFGTEAPVDVQGMKQFLDQFSDMMGTMKEGQSPMRLVEMVKAFKTPEQLANFAKNATKPGLKDALMNLWINSLLSGPHTHGANILGNGATLAWAIGERQIAGLLGGEIRPTEAAAMVYGIYESFGEALRAGWEVAKHGAEASQFGGAAKVEARPRISFQEAGLTGVPGQALDYLSAFFEGMGGRTLMATDEFFKAIAFRAELRARAMREAYNVVNAEGLTGKAARKKVAELQEKYLNDVPDDIQKDAEKFSAYVTFTKNLGPTGQWLADGSAKHPAVKLVLPFVKAPINIFKFAGERIPGIGQMNKAFWSDIQAGGSRAELASAKLAMGSMIAGLGTLWAADGIITGGGPNQRKNKELSAVMKEGGWQPYSINVSALKRKAKGEATEWQKGDQFVSINRVEPLGMLLGLYANYVEIVSNTEKDETWDETANTLLMATVKAMASKTFIKGLSQTALAFAFPDEFLGDTLNKQAVSFIPVVGSSLSRQIAKTVDPIAREAEGFIQELMKNTPGLSKYLEPTLHPISGEPVYREGGVGPDIASPLYQSTYKKDPVIEEIVRNKVNISKHTGFIHGVELSQEGKTELQRMITHDVKKGGRNLHDALDHLMNSAVYKNGSPGPDGRRALLIRNLIHAFHEKGELMMLKKYPDLKQKMKDLQKEHAQKMKTVRPLPSEEAIDASDIDLDALSVAGQ